MRNRSRYDLVSVYSGIPIIQRLWGLSVTEDDYIEDAIECMDQHLNMSNGEYHIHKKEIPEDLFVEMPDYDYIVGVYVDIPEDPTVLIPKIRENPKSYNGALINYIVREGGIVIEDPAHFLVGKTAVVIYSKALTDDEGHLLLTKKQVLAVANYSAHRHFRKRALMGDQQASAALALVEPEMDAAISSATMEDITVNALDASLDSITNFNRKFYGQSFRHSR